MIFVVSGEFETTRLTAEKCDVSPSRHASREHETIGIAAQNLAAERRDSLAHVVLRPRRVAAPKILVVEDDADTRTILVEFFEAQGYEVTAVATAEAALDALREHGADLVLSDNQLDGEATGASMLKHAFEQGLLKKVGAVMYTADANPGVPRVVRVLHKPLPLRELELTAERAIDSARSRELPPSSRSF